MPTYSLRFSQDNHGEAKRVEFEAEDASAALIVAHQEALNRSAELWCDGRRLCSIRRTGQGGDVWLINSLRQQPLGT